MSANSVSVEHAAPTKDPSDIDIHAFDWTAWLREGETIAAQTVTAEPGLTVDQVSQSEGVVQYRVAGGQAGTEYGVTCEISTSLGRVKQSTVTYKVEER